MAQNPHLRRHDVELLAGLLTDDLECGPIVRTMALSLGQLVAHLDAFELSRQAALAAATR